MLGALSLLWVSLALAASPVQPGQPTVELRLCRAYVTPCQDEVNLPVGGAVTLSLRLDAGGSTAPAESHSVFAWYVKLLLHGDKAVQVPRQRSTGGPFQEQGAPGLALNGLVPLTVQPARLGLESNSYYRVRNGYDSRERTAEYAITRLGDPAGADGLPPIPLPADGSVLIGNLTLRGSRAGTTQLAASDAATASPQLVVAQGSEELSPIDLATTNPLAVVNVGPDAEKARLEGRIWSDMPAGDDAFHPYTGEFGVELWPSGAVPVWQGGTDLPTATFTNLTTDGKGKYSVPDLSPQIIPAGRYDLRVKGPGTLTVLAERVRIDPSGGEGDDLPLVVEVDFGPLLSGDLTGDNVVDEADLAMLASNVGKRVRDSAALARADFNGDEVVDGQDFSLLAASYGRHGE